jgi:hypothetical protein
MVIGKARHHIRVSGGEHLGIAQPAMWGITRAWR